MRSTVSDSSGNPENGENPEYGGERYGALPVREWALPDRPGRDASVPGGADDSARADGVPDADGPMGPGTETGGYDWSASGAAGAADASDAPSATDGRGEAGSGTEPDSRSGSGTGSGLGPASGSGWEGVSGSGSGSEPGKGAAYEVGSAARSGPDSVVDLVLDLMPGEGERGGSAFGATSAAVTVPGAAPEPAPAAGTWDLLPAPTAEKRATASLPELGATGFASRSETAATAFVRDADPAVSEAVGEVVPEVVPEVREAVPEVVREAALDPLPGDRVAAAESGALLGAEPANGLRGGSENNRPGQSAPEDGPFLMGLDDAPAPGPGFVPGPGLAAVRRDAGPSLSLSFGGADTGELRTEVRVDTGRHHSVIANERTASIPVHLLFRDDPEAAGDAVGLPATVVRRTAGSEQAAGVRRPPVPRAPQVRPSTRPAPVADPRLHERPGPALPGWAALLTGLGALAAAGGVLWWIGALPGGVLSRLGLGPRSYDGIGLGAWAALALLLTVVLFALGGLTRGRVGYAWVLTLFGRYRGSVRRTGLMWVSPLLLRRRVDVRLRHWRSEPLPAVDANGTALRVVVLVVWRVKDTVRATLGIADHEDYLREQVEAAMARVLSQLPADAFHEDAHTLRNAEAVGDALTRMLKADCEPVGIEVYSAQPTGIEYAPEVAAAMQRRRIAAIDAKHRDSVLTSVVDAVDDTVNRLTARGLVALDDYERKSLVKDLTVAFYTGRGGGDSA